MQFHFVFFRAEDFDKLKLLRKVFVAWQRRAQVMQLKADELCRKHLLRKGMKGFVYAMEHQGMAVDDFVVKQRKVLVKKYWQMVRLQTNSFLFYLRKTGAECWLCTRNCLWKGAIN